MQRRGNSEETIALAPPLMHAFRAAHQRARREGAGRHPRRRRAGHRAPTRDGARADLGERAAQAGEFRSRRAPEHDQSRLRPKICPTRPKCASRSSISGFPISRRVSIDENDVSDIAREIETALARLRAKARARTRSRRGATIASTPTNCACGFWSAPSCGSSPSTSRWSSSRRWSSIRARSRSIGCRR